MFHESTELLASDIVVQDARDSKLSSAEQWSQRLHCHLIECIEFSHTRGAKSVLWYKGEHTKPERRMTAHLPTRCTIPLHTHDRRAAHLQGDLKKEHDDG